ncbi:hypothetical protein DFH07DRAFT_774924 [Mycena maculata]|uniref:Uncharacterized protein n=1 Tax=Mycena maculata TaxID=230809 RepID=A0AAD7IVN7_9AGAR|nr:hypothetical protein DFH07DRAFT_774924 [Mycena maculata]
MAAGRAKSASGDTVHQQRTGVDGVDEAVAPSTAYNVWDENEDERPRAAVTAGRATDTRFATRHAKAVARKRAVCGRRRCRYRERRRGLVPTGDLDEALVANGVRTKANEAHTHYGNGGSRYETKTKDEVPACHGNMPTKDLSCDWSPASGRAKNETKTKDNAPTCYGNSGSRDEYESGYGARKQRNGIADVDKEAARVRAAMDEGTVVRTDESAIKGRQPGSRWTRRPHATVTAGRATNTTGLRADGGPQPQPWLERIPQTPYEGGDGEETNHAYSNGGSRLRGASRDRKESGHAACRQRSGIVGVCETVARMRSACGQRHQVAPEDKR